MVEEKGGASEAQVGPTGQTTASDGGNFALLAGARMHRECMGGTGAGSPARQRQPAATEQRNSDLCCVYINPQAIGVYTNPI